MIKLTWGDLVDNDFLSALNKLYTIQMDIDDAIYFASLGKEIKSQQAIFDEAHDDLLKKYARPSEQFPGRLEIIEETKEEFKLEHEKLKATEFFLNAKKFNASKISSCAKFSPQEIMLLQKIFDFDLSKDSNTQSRGQAELECSAH